MLNLDLLDVFGIGQILKGMNKEDKKAEQRESQPDFVQEQKDKLRQNSYVPETLANFIGQEHAKLIVQTNIEMIKLIKPVHMVLSGVFGSGKTSLARIISKELNFRIFSYIGADFSKDDLKSFLIDSEKGALPSILFIDELHSLKRSIAHMLLPLLENFKLNGEIAVRPFIFIGCSTERHTLMEKFAPLVSRCGVDLLLEAYSSSDIVKILRQYNSKTFQAEATDEIFSIIANNCRYNPRNALHLFDSWYITKDIKKVLYMNQIVKDSLRKDDIKVLEALAESKNGVSEEVLSMLTEQSIEDFLSRQEDYLIRQQYIVRTFTGRKIASKGLAILEQIKKGGE